LALRGRDIIAVFPRWIVGRLGDSGFSSGNPIRSSAEMARGIGGKPAWSSGTTSASVVVVLVWTCRFFGDVTGLGLISVVVGDPICGATAASRFFGDFWMTAEVLCASVSVKG
jgi:hypothetical protein